MKCETTNTVLTLVLAVLVLTGVLFALQTIFRTREIRSIQAELLEHQNNMNRAAVVFNDAAIYGKTHPDINRILQPFLTKPAAR